MAFPAASPYAAPRQQAHAYHPQAPRAGPAFDAWRSPPPKDTPLVETTPLPLHAVSPQHPDKTLHPSFLPPCEHSGDKGDMHGHAFDLLSLSTNENKTQSPPIQAAAQAVPSSVPGHPASFLSSTRPIGSNGTAPNTNPAGLAPKPRRMSSSTTGALGRGKLGLTGDQAQKEGRPAITPSASYSGTPVKRPTLATSPTPQLFDFAKTDRRPVKAANGRTVSAGVVPASLPTHAGLHAHIQAAQAAQDDMELDMEFGEGEDEDEGEGSGRSGSAEAEEGEEGDWKKLALGSGSGGVKGRRKGMVFKCETCSKEYRHPSCLVKHRWEHSPHWKESNQLSMSKHQQVQMLEAAAILAYLDPSANGRALPNDKSLWPAILSPPDSNSGYMPNARRMSSSQGMLSPPSTAAPLTPSSLRESSTLGAMAEQARERKSSPSSDSTSSSMGAGEPYVPHTAPAPVNGRGMGRSPISPAHMHKPLGAAGRAPSFSSSLPRQMADMRFGSFGGSPSSLSGALAGGAPSSGGGFSPATRGGIFGTGSLSRPSSSMRSGVEDLPEADEDEEAELQRMAAADRNRGVPAQPRGFGLAFAKTNGNGNGVHRQGRGKSSSEEAEERRKDEEYGMAMEMEL